MLVKFLQKKNFFSEDIVATLLKLFLPLKSNLSKTLKQKRIKKSLTCAYDWLLKILVSFQMNFFYLVMTAPSFHGSSIQILFIYSYQVCGYKIPSTSDAMNKRKDYGSTAERESKRKSTSGENRQWTLNTHLFLFYGLDRDSIVDYIARGWNK